MLKNKWVLIVHREILPDMELALSVRDENGDTIGDETVFPSSCSEFYYECARVLGEDEQYVFVQLRDRDSKLDSLQRLFSKDAISNGRGMLGFFFDTEDALDEHLRKIEHQHLIPVARGGVPDPNFHPERQTTN